MAVFLKCVIVWPWVTRQANVTLETGLPNSINFHFPQFHLHVRPIHPPPWWSQGEGVILVPEKLRNLPTGSFYCCLISQQVSLTNQVNSLLVIFSVHHCSLAWLPIPSLAIRIFFLFLFSLLWISPFSYKGPQRHTRCQSLALSLCDIDCFKIWLSIQSSAVGWPTLRLGLCYHLVSSGYCISAAFISKQF